jgi:hypothetical protein
MPGRKAPALWMGRRTHAGGGGGGGMAAPLPLLLRPQLLHGPRGATLRPFFRPDVFPERGPPPGA